MSREYYKTQEEMEEDIDNELLKELNEGKNTNHYVDNERLCRELTEYRERFLEYKDKLSELGEDEEPPARPKMNEYIGECIVKVAYRYARMPNYSSYPHVDYMIGDAIENCVRYIHNFDPSKSSNAFAYVTQQVKRSFHRRIRREKKERYKQAIKIQRAGVEDQILETQDQDMDEDFRHTWVEKLQESSEVIEDFENLVAREKEKEKERKKKKEGSLEDHEEQDSEDESEDEQENEEGESE